MIINGLFIALAVCGITAVIIIARFCAIYLRDDRGDRISEEPADPEWAAKLRAAIEHDHQRAAQEGRAARPSAAAATAWPMSPPINVPGREPPDRPEAGESAPAVQQAAAEMARPAGDPLTRARAAMDELAVMPPSTYLAQLAAGTAYAERPPLRSWLSDDTIARGMPAIRLPGDADMPLSAPQEWHQEMENQP